MRADVKICGLATPTALAAAIDGGAAFVGFVFYPPSPRCLDLAIARDLMAAVPAHIGKVAVLVDPSDDGVAAVSALPIDMIQLHGSETPRRVAAVAAASGRRVIKAIAVAEAGDLGIVADYASVADMLLFDAKPPKDWAGNLPGGNGLAFDWRLLDGLDPGRPWFLSGGLTPETVAEALALTGAALVDVSSGVERAPGIKDEAKIRAFLAAVQKGNESA